MSRLIPVLTTTAAVSLALTPSSADAQFLEFINYVRQGYGVYQSMQNTPSDVAVLQALITQSKAEILSELGAITAAEISSCANHAVNTFEKIHLLTSDNVQAFAIASDKCVTDAQAQIAAVTDKNAVNQMGMALNIVGPIALAANAYARLPTDTLKTRIMQANRQLVNRLNPVCGVSVLSPDELPRFSGTVRGRGACHNFTYTGATRIQVGSRGGVFYLAPGPGRAFLPWQLWGKAIPDDEVLWWRGHTAYFPRGVDTSIAAQQVMQGTSWQLANEALEILSSPALPYGSPLVIAVSEDAIYKPVTVYLVARGYLFRGEFNTSTDLDNPTFGGWTREDSKFASLSAATRFDKRVEQFGISRIGGIHHRWQHMPGDSANWSPMAQFDGQLNSVSAARNRDGTLQIFGTNPFGNVWTRNQILGGDRFEQVQEANPKPPISTWSPWRAIDGSLMRIAAATNARGRIALLGVNAAGAVYFRQQLQPNAVDPAAANAWSGWQQIDVPAPVESTALANDLGDRLNLFILTRQGQVFHSTGDAAYHTRWVEIPRTMRSIAAGKQGGGAGRMMLVGQATDGRYYENTSTGLMVSVPEGGFVTGPWRGWRPLPNPPFPRNLPVPPVERDPR